MAEERYNGKANLIDLRSRPEEERKRIAAAGGKASGEKKRFSKDLRDSIKLMLELTATTTKQQEVLGDDAELLKDYKVTMADLINLKMLQAAGEGNTKAWELLRDTAGFKPVDQIQTDVNLISDADRALIEKIAEREGIKQPEG